MRSYIVLLSFAVAVFAAGEATPQTGPTSLPKPGKFVWRSIGPGQFGAMFGLGISPHDSNVIVAGVDMGNAFMTRDWGKSWKILGRNGGEPFANPGYRGVWGVHFDPKRPERIWIGSTHGLYRTTDGGENWHLALGGGADYVISAIMTDPTDPDIVYAGSGMGARTNVGWSLGNVWKSTDEGKTWQVLGNVSRKGRNWVNIAVDPQSSFIPDRGHSRVYICGQGGFFTSNDAGETWTSLKEFLPNGSDSDISTLVLVPGEERSSLLVTIRARYADPEKKQLVGGVYASADGGKTWVAKNHGLEKSIAYMAERMIPRGYDYSLLVGCQAKPRIMYWANYPQGVFKTEDGGETWRGLLNFSTDWVKGPDFDGKEIHWLLRSHGGNFGQSYYNSYGPANGLACSATDPDAVAYTDNAGLAVSFDGGENWTEPGFEFGEAVWPGKFGDRPPMRLTHKVRSRGLQLIVPIDAAVDPFDPQTIAIGHCDIGLMISRDGGTWWEWAYQGILAGERKYIRAVLYDPALKGCMWVGGGVGSGSGRVYQSNDGGRTFHIIGIPQLTAEAERSQRALHVHALALDLISPQEARTLYAGTDFGLFKTTDGGKTWEALPLGLASTPGVRRIVLDSTNPARLYIAIRTNSNAESGLYRSEDSGKTWERLGAGQIFGVKSLSLCQATGVLYTLAYNQPGGGYFVARTLWRSDDHGETWKKLDNRLAACVAVHPQDPDQVFFVTFAGDVRKEKANVWASLDGGKNWETIADDIPISPGSEYNKIVFDPTNPSRFLLLHNSGTYEGRVAKTD